jgi:hypothetical protein
MISIFLRYERILLCCGIYKNDKADIKQFYNKRYMYLEKYYFRILFIAFFIFLVITIIIRAIKLEYCEAFFTNDKTDIDIIKITIWIIWNFLEQIVIVTYLFRMSYTINPHQFINFELYSFLIIWFLYSNFIFLFTYIQKANNDSELVYISIAMNYICLLINGFLPIILSCTKQALMTYHFTFQLMNNLYLFLTDETCYESFNKYLIKKKKDDIKDNGSYLLILYTHIMEYKLDFLLNERPEQIHDSAVQIFNTYFGKENNNIDEVVASKVKNDCKALTTKNTYNKNLFDEALKYSFDELNKRFNEFKVTREYNLLFTNIMMTSYIRCKMGNVGLINKY